MLGNCTQCQTSCTFLYYSLLDLFSFSPSTVFLHGTKYRVGAVLYVGQRDDLPEFSSIQGIFVFNTVSKIYFIVKSLKTIMFSNHFHSYEIQTPSLSADAFILEPEQLKVYLPMHVVKPSRCENSPLYVSPSYLPPQRM